MSPSALRMMKWRRNNYEYVALCKTLQQDGKMVKLQKIRSARKVKRLAKIKAFHKTSKWKAHCKARNRRHYLRHRIRRKVADQNRYFYKRWGTTDRMVIAGLKKVKHEAALERAASQRKIYASLHKTEIRRYSRNYLRKWRRKHAPPPRFCRCGHSDVPLKGAECYCESCRLIAKAKNRERHEECKRAKKRKLYALNPRRCRCCFNPLKYKYLKVRCVSCTRKEDTTRRQLIRDKKHRSAQSRQKFLKNIKKFWSEEAKRQRERLSDGYVKKQLSKSWLLPRKLIPDSVVELKRVILKGKRLCQQHQEISVN